MTNRGSRALHDREIRLGQSTASGETGQLPANAIHVSTERDPARGVKELVGRDKMPGHIGATAGTTSGEMIRESATAGMHEKAKGKKGASRGGDQSELAADALASKSGFSGVETDRGGVSTLTKASFQDGSNTNKKARGTDNSRLTRGIADRASLAPPAMNDGTGSSRTSLRQTILMTPKPKTAALEGTRTAVRVSGPREGSIAGAAPPRIEAIMDSSNGKVKTESFQPPPLTQGMKGVRERKGPMAPGAPQWASAISRAQHRA